MPTQSHKIVTPGTRRRPLEDTTMEVVPEHSAPTTRVQKMQDGDGVVLTVGGSLNSDTGAVLVAEVLAAVEAGTKRLDIDLQEIESFDEDGAAALLACRDAAGDLGGGLHYRTCSGGPGQDALLQAYADQG